MEITSSAWVLSLSKHFQGPQHTDSKSTEPQRYLGRSRMVCSQRLGEITEKGARVMTKTGDDEESE